MPHAGVVGVVAHPVALVDLDVVVALQQQSAEPDEALQDDALAGRRARAPSCPGPGAG